MAISNIGMTSIGVATILSALGTAVGQTYPTRLVRIVTTGVGGNNDSTARAISPALSAALGQQVIVDNRGDGIIAAELVAKAPPDGYTLLINGADLWFGPLLQATPYDPLTAFSPITMVNKQPNIVVVHPILPVKSVKELIALARAKPGALNYSTGSTGSSSHLAPELFKAMTRVNMIRVPYKSGSARIAALLGGEMQLEFAVPGQVMPYVKSGRLRALAVTSAQTSVLFPELPTVATWVPGYYYVGMTGIFAPAKTPATIVAQLQQTIARLLQQSEIRERLLNAGVEPGGNSPEEFAAQVKAEVVRMAKVLKDAGIHAD